MTRKLIIDDIRASGWRLHLRDEATGEVEDVAFDPKDAWRLIRATGDAADAAPKVDTSAIRLHVDNMGGVGVVHVTAKGRGAASWSERTGGILGTKWKRNAEGAPNVVLDDSRDFLDDLRREFPDVTIDDSLYVPGIAPFSPAADDAPANDSPRSGPPLSKKRKGKRRKGGNRRVEVPEPEEDDELPGLPPDAEITLKLDNLDREDGTVLIVAQGDRAGEWVAAQGTLLGSRWEHADGVPYVIVMDEVDLSRQIQREHPQVRLDIVEYAPRTREELIQLEAKSAQPAAAAAIEPMQRELASAPPDVGPGGLVWTPILDQGIDGAAARWLDGQFKILHAAGRQHALFYEYDHGGYVHISCGTEDALKQLAGATPMMERPRRSINHELARLACPAPEVAPMPQPAEPVQEPAAKPAKPKPVAKVSIAKVQQELEEERQQVTREASEPAELVIPPDIEARLRQVADQLQLPA